MFALKPTRNLVRFAHNWNDETMEYWNIGCFLHCIDPKSFDSKTEVMRF